MVPKLFELGAGFRFLGPPWAKARKKGLHFDSISDFAIFSSKIIVISKKKRVFTSISDFAIFSSKIAVISKKGLHFDSSSSFAISLLKGKKVKLGYSRYNSMQLWLKVSAYILKKKLCRP